MKNRITRVAFVTAMTMAIARLMLAPKSILVASTVTSVRINRMPPVAISVLMVATWASPWSSWSLWCSVAAMLLLVDEVEEREQEDPDQIDDVPVQRGVVDRPEVFGCELAL